MSVGHVRQGRPTHVGQGQLVGELGVGFPGGAAEHHQGVVVEEDLKV